MRLIYACMVALFVLGVGGLIMQMRAVEALAQDQDPFGFDPGCPVDARHNAYEAELIRVVDCDTVEARVFFPLGIEAVRMVRFAGIDAPEKHTVQGKKCADRLRDLLGAQTKLYLREIEEQKYAGRFAAHVHLGRWEPSLSRRLWETGYARRYDGGKREPFPDGYPMTPPAAAVTADEAEEWYYEAIE